MKSIFLYVLLVGVPVLAVLGVLRVGQQLRSPIFVGGTWNVERSPKTGAASKCSESFILSDRTVLTISQSGSRLLLTLDNENRTTLTGEIRNTTITATTARLVSNASLDAQGRSDASIQIHATVEEGSGSERLLGLRTSIGLVSGAEMWFYCALIIAVAITGKFGGASLSACLSGMSWREAGAIGVLMNTRGLMELVILNIGLEIGVISPAVSR
jgi:hypothetical protein